MQFLKDILGEGLANQVIAALKGKGKDGKDVELAIANDGSYLPKGKIDELKTEIKGLKSQLAERDHDLAEARKGAGDNEALREQIKGWEKKYKDGTTELENQLKQTRRDAAIDTALLDAKAKNVKAARALIDLDKIVLDGDKLLGLDDQLTTIQKDAAYLFDAAPASDTGGGGGYPYKPAGGGGNPDFSAMSDADYYAFTQKKG